MIGTVSLGLLQEEQEYYITADVAISDKNQLSSFAYRINVFSTDAQNTQFHSQMNTIMRTSSSKII